MKVHLGRVLGGVAGGMSSIILALCFFGAHVGIDLRAASFALPFNDGAATWRLVESRPIASLANGATVVSRTITGPAKCTLTLVFFDEKNCRVQVASQSSQKDSKFIADWAAQTQAIACCNGGYFNPATMQPAGLEIANGVRTGTFGRSGASGGAFGCRKGVLFLENEKDFPLTDDITEFLQCGPMLVEASKPAVNMVEKFRTRLTFLMTNGQGRWAIGTAESASYSGLAAMLTNRQIIPEFAVATALNLDGGPSTTLWWREPNGKTRPLKESWPVRNILLVSPR